MRQTPSLGPPSIRKGLRGFVGKREEDEVSCIKEELWALDEVNLDFILGGLADLWSPGRRLDFYFIDWLAIQSLVKNNLIRPYKQAVLLLTDFLECWWFGPVQKVKKNKTCRTFLSNGHSGSTSPWSIPVLLHKNEATK